MDNTMILQGKFTSDGASRFIPLRSGCDWIETYNYTQSAAAQIGAVGTEFYWQAGMAQDSAFEKTKGVAGAVGQFVVTTGGFKLIDTSVNMLGPVVANITAISNAATPVVTTAAPHGLVLGDIVKLIDITGGYQLGGMDFSVGTPGLATTFPLEYMAQIVAATTGSWQKIEAPAISFYPPHRFITKVVAGVTTVITLSVLHLYEVGQQVRVMIPEAFGMTLPPTQGTIIAIDIPNNTITVDIDTSALAAFVFPLTGAGAFTPAMVVPIGENTAKALSSGTNILSDATINAGVIYMKLAAGVDSPAGQNGDVIYWKAGKSFSIDN